MENEYLVEKINKINECEGTLVMKLSKYVYPFLMSLGGSIVGTHGFDVASSFILGSTFLMQGEYNNTLSNNRVIKSVYIIQDLEDNRSEKEEEELIFFYESSDLVFVSEFRIILFRLFLDCFNIGILELLSIMNQNNIRAFTGALEGFFVSRIIYNFNELLASKSILKNIRLYSELNEVKLKREK